MGLASNHEQCVETAPICISMSIAQNAPPSPGCRLYKASCVNWHKYATAGTQRVMQLVPTYAFQRRAGRTPRSSRARARHVACKPMRGRHRPQCCCSEKQRHRERRAGCPRAGAVQAERPPPPTPAPVHGRASLAAPRVAAGGSDSPRRLSGTPVPGTGPERRSQAPARLPAVGFPEPSGGGRRFST